VTDHHDPGWEEPDRHDPGPDPAGWPEHTPWEYGHSLHAEDTPVPDGDPWRDRWGADAPAGGFGGGAAVEPDLSDVGDLSGEPGGYGERYGEPGDVLGAGVPDLLDLPGLDLPGLDLPGEALGRHGGGLLDSWPVGADPDHLTEPAHLDPFPASLDLPLPEPVDGFPWADPALLGAAPIDALDPALHLGLDPAPGLDPALGLDPAAPVDPAGLAASAGMELPPDADPWAVLAASDDPATNTLARWWAPDPPPAG
jgi:hypothetical protein